MKLYADDSVRRTRQLVGDAFLALWLLLWVELGYVIYDTTMLLAVPGRKLESSGQGLADRLRDAGAAVDGTPLIGEALRAPFEGAGSAAEELAGAGTSQVDAVGELAMWLGLVVAAIPILVALIGYVPFRIRFVRQASAAQRFIDSADDLDLFALRALANQPMHRLARISDDPAGAWRRGDQAVVRRLADLELRASGLRAPG